MKLKIAFATILIVFMPLSVFSYQDFESRDFYYYSYSDQEEKWKKTDLELITNTLTIQATSGAKISSSECRTLSLKFNPSGYECWLEQGIIYLFFDVKQDSNDFLKKINSFNRGHKKVGAFPIFIDIKQPEKIYILTNQLKLEFVGRLSSEHLIKNWGFRIAAKEGNKFIIEPSQTENTLALAKKIYGLESVALSEPVFMKILDLRSFYDDSYLFDYWGVEFKKSAEVVVGKSNGLVFFNTKEIDEINKKYNIRNITKYYYIEKTFHHYNEISFVNVLETKRLQSFEEIDFLGVYSVSPAIKMVKNALSWRNEIYPLIPFSLP